MESFPKSRWPDCARSCRRERQIVESWRALADKLAPALIAAHQPEEALQFLADPRWEKSPSWNFWRGQALAALGKWNDALPCFQAATNGSLSADATFAIGQAYEATGQTDQGAYKPSIRFSGTTAGTRRARLRYANLLLERSDWNGAERVLDQANPTTTADRKERRSLKARVDLARHRPDRALPTFESLATRTEGANHELIVAALFGVADSHLQLKTPEQGDDFLEDFIEHHPRDPSLPETLCQTRCALSGGTKTVAHGVGTMGARSRTTATGLCAVVLGSDGYARRAPRACLEDFSTICAKTAQRFPGISEGYLEFAQVAAAEGQNEKAIAILDEARAPTTRHRLSSRVLRCYQGELLFEAKKFDQATRPLREGRGPNFRRSPESARYNASLGWLEQGNHNEFLKIQQRAGKIRRRS